MGSVNIHILNILIGMKATIQPFIKNIRCVGDVTIHRNTQWHGQYRVFSLPAGNLFNNRSLHTRNYLLCDFVHPPRSSYPHNLSFQLPE